MTTTHDLWSILHDADLEAVQVGEGTCTLIIDSPHVRKHQGHDETQRYEVRCEAVTVRSFSIWQPPADPRPSHQKGFDPELHANAEQEWWSRGIFIESDWSKFVAALATEEGSFWLIEATLEEIRRAVLHGGDGGAHVGVSGEHDDGQVGVVGSERLKGANAVGIGEAQIEQHHIGRVLGSQTSAFGGGRRPARREAKRLEEFDQGRAHRFVVVDHEQGQRHVAAVGGSVRVSVVPASGTLSMLIVPPCSSMMRWQSASPMPVPPALVE